MNSGAWGRPRRGLRPRLVCLTPAFSPEPAPGGAFAPAKDSGPAPGGAFAPAQNSDPAPGEAFAPAEDSGPAPGGVKAPATPDLSQGFMKIFTFLNIPPPSKNPRLFFLAQPTATT